MEIGKVSNYFDHVGAAAVKLSKELKVGEKIRIKGGGVDFEQEVREMQINKKSVGKAKKGDEVGIIVDQKVRKGYKIFKV